MTKGLTISDIKEKLQTVSTQTDPFFKSIVDDERKGVQKLIESWKKDQLKKEKIKEHSEFMCRYERDGLAKGYKMIAGIDEVGRGPLAGPVVAAAVILPKDFEVLEINDSKQLSEKKRDDYYDLIMEQAVAVSVGLVDEREIDNINIYQATKLAMKKAVGKLCFRPDYLLIDAMVLEDVEIDQESIIKGDAKSVSIACASIVAKVTRDQIMKDFDKQYPGYRFGNNAGYGTKEHLNGLENLGVCPIHRRTFAPIKNMI